MEEENEFDFDVLNTSEETEEKKELIDINQNIEENSDEDLDNILSQFSNEEKNQEEEEKDFSLNTYISKLMNLEEGKFLTGNEENPIEINVQDLNEKQKIALLEHHFKSKNKNVPSIELHEDEQKVIDLLREGKIEDLYYELQTELAYNGKLNLEQTQETPEGDDLLIWNIKEEYPDFNDEEIETELQLIKESPNLERKLQVAEAKFLKTNEEKLEQEKQKIQEEEIQTQESLKADYKNYSDNFDISSVATGFSFEPDEEKQLKEEALSEIFEDNKLVDELSSPEGLYKTALMRSLFPKILDYVNKIESDNQELKLKDKTSKRVSSFAKKEKANEESLFDKIKIID